MANLCIKTPSSAILVLIFQLLVLRPRPNLQCILNNILTKRSHFVYSVDLWHLVHWYWPTLVCIPFLASKRNELPWTRLGNLSRAIHFWITPFCDTLNNCACAYFCSFRIFVDLEKCPHPLPTPLGRNQPKQLLSIREQNTNAGSFFEWYGIWVCMWVFKR